VKIGYADPPYIGCAHLYANHPDYAGEVDHEELIGRLQDEFDGWVLHASATPRSMAVLAHIGDVMTTNTEATKARSLMCRYRRGREADRRGWRSLGLLIRATLDGKSQAVIDRLIRYSNRLYRLNYGKSPWRKCNGF
jgi:hypothetical protein